MTLVAACAWGLHLSPSSSAPVCLTRAPAQQGCGNVVLYIAGHAVGDWLFPRRPVANNSPCLLGPTFFPAPLNAYPVPPSVGTCSWRQLASRLVGSVNGKLCTRGSATSTSVFVLASCTAANTLQYPLFPGRRMRQLAQAASTNQQCPRNMETCKPWRISEDLQRGVALSGMSTRKSRFLSFRRPLLPPRRAPPWHSIMTVRTNDTAQERGEVVRARRWSRQARPSRTLGPGANSIALPASCCVSLLRTANPQP